MKGTRTDALAPAALERFTRTAEIASTEVIRSYSTSFGLATRLLGRRHRQHIRNVYAMVRVADEIVDGVASEAGLSARGQRAALDAYVAETHAAMRTGYSTNMVLHAFSRTARLCGIGEHLTQPFFDSMRADLSEGAERHDADSHARYVHGSAEVVGLMCVRVFLLGSALDETRLAALEHGATRLGAAFQNVNFLRDLADDTDRLHRGYLAGGRHLTTADRDAWIATIRGQLDDARDAIPLLPRDCRAAVRSAHALFSALADRISRTPVETLYVRRVRVPDPIKALLAARSVIATALESER